MIEKLTQIKTIIDEIGSADPDTANILLDFFMASIAVLEKLASDQEAGIITQELDISQKIKLVSGIVGLDLDQLVKYTISQSQEGESKEADQGTLDFITSDLDDYEKFLASNKSKEALDYLKSEI
jgi:phosphoribulokinase